MNTATANAIARALRAERERVLTVAYADSERASRTSTAYRMLCHAYPDLTPSEWYAHASTCDDAYSCCGYCPEHEDHHGDSRDEVCNMGHCHSCEHNCDD